MSKDIKVRMNWLRGMYSYTIVGAGLLGLGMLVMPELIKSMFAWPIEEPIAFGILGSVYVAFGILSILGLRDPLKFAPVLLLQLFYLGQYDIPNYQWSALDVCSRFKLIGYSREKSWTNGLCWYLWVISWLRSHGVESTIVFTVDNGEEFGGKSWLKVRELRKLISGFGCRLIQNHKGHCEENAHLERSHRTDDDEFYIPRAMRIKSDVDLLDEALGYIYYYNNLREHSSLDFKTPFFYLKAQLPDIDDKIRFVIPIMLDKVAVELGAWSGYHVLAQHPAMFP